MSMSTIRWLGEGDDAIDLGYRRAVPSACRGSPGDGDRASARSGLPMPRRRAGVEAMTTALVLHGGAGLDPAHDYAVELAHLQAVAEHGRDCLSRGIEAAKVAVAVVAALEESGHYIAGRGCSPNSAGRFELDAAVMDGATGTAGAVACLEGYRSAIFAAEAVRSRSPHLLLAGKGAAEMADAAGCARATPDWYRPAGLGELLGGHDDAHGTVGCAVLDAAGRIATAVSTGGTFGKSQGRIGDTPLIGAGSWADARVGVVCTGIGEYFMRVAAAARLAHLVEFGGRDLRAGGADILRRVAAAGGAGGLIALDRDGGIVFGRARAGLKGAAVWPDGEVSAHIFWPDRPAMERGREAGDAYVAIDDRMEEPA